MSKRITNYDDTIDSRALFARRNELREEIEGLFPPAQCSDHIDLDAVTTLEDGPGIPPEKWDAIVHLFANIEPKSDPDELHELLMEFIGLRDLCENACLSEGDSTTLVHDEYFKQYCIDLADDLHSGIRENHWPFNHIDWDAASEAAKVDYTEVMFGDQKYWRHE